MLPEKKFFVTHRSPHPDEVASICAIKWHGGKTLPVFHKTEVFFPTNRNEPCCEPNEAYFIGIGGGELDEHGKDREKSALSIVLNKLNLQEDYVWSRILAWVNRSDSAQGRGCRGGPLNLQSILGAINWENVADSSVGFNWCQTVISAINRLGRDYFKNGNCQEAGRFFELLACLWAVERFSNVSFKNALNGFFPLNGSSEDTFEGVLNFIKKGDDPILGTVRGMGKYVANGCQKELYPFSLPRGSYAIYRTAKSNSLLKAYHWAKLALDCWYADQVGFFKVLHGLRRGDSAYRIWDMPGYKGKKIILVADTKYQATLRACSYHFGDNFGILIQTSPCFGTQIFSNTSLSFNPLDNAIEMIRRKELELLRMPTTGLSENDFRGEGSTCELDHICYIVQKREKDRVIGSNMILNRSGSNPCAQLLKIKISDLTDMVNESFSNGVRKKFKLLKKEAA